MTEFELSPSYWHPDLWVYAHHFFWVKLLSVSVDKYLWVSGPIESYIYFTRIKMILKIFILEDQELLTKGKKETTLSWKKGEGEGEGGKRKVFWQVIKSSIKALSSLSLSVFLSFPFVICHLVSILFPVLHWIIKMLAKKYFKMFLPPSFSHQSV